jgi:hypothetical protein
MQFFGRTTPRVVAWASGWAVRRDWPDGGHEYVGFGLTHADAELFGVGDRRFWLRSHVRPVYSLVQISTRDFELHVGRRLCRSPDCPVGTVVAAGVVVLEGEVR